MKLNRLLKNVESVVIKGDVNCDIDDIFYDSKQLKQGGLFFAVNGTKFRGMDFIDEAIERGAVCVVSEEDFISFKNVTKVIVNDIRKVCAIAANNFYDYPSQRMKVVGITGTNGKTTVLYLINYILKQTGRKCGTIGTISYNLGQRRIPAVNTTPSAIMLQRLLNEMVEGKVPYCIMEVSSHSLHQKRVDGVKYRYAIFTNLSDEHLDYHKTKEEYFNAKSRLFSMCGAEDTAIINIDDYYGKRIASLREGKMLTYGIDEEANIKASDISSTIDGSKFTVSVPGGQLNIETCLIGRHNVYNILAAISFAIADGIGIKYIEDAVMYFKGTPGRLQKIDCGQKFYVFVDYAHTEDALKNVLTTLRNIAGKKIIVVFGCGGDRDRAKRPKMAETAALLADFVIVTSDNPRSEKPSNIIDDILKGMPKGFKNYKSFVDRKEAIETSLSMADDGDIVLIAGKGHETYQILGDDILDFDDRKVCQGILASLCGTETIL